MADIKTPFCRVFTIPKTDEIPLNYCFGGGYPFPCKIVDWFNAEPNMEAVSDKTADELVKFIKGKQYYKPDKLFLAVTDFGLTIQITG